jgi:hypothetical protein
MVLFNPDNDVKNPLVYTLPPTPTPPNVTMEPVLVLVDATVLVMDRLAVLRVPPT